MIPSALSNAEWNSSRPKICVGRLWPMAFGKNAIAADRMTGRINPAHDSEHGVRAQINLHVAPDQGGVVIP
jgi:hypothetical protein